MGINYAPEPTGIAPYTARAAEGLAARGHDIRVVTTFPHYPQWRIGPEWSGWTRHEDQRDVAIKRVRHYVPARPQGLPRAMSEISFGARGVASRWHRPDVVVCISPALLASAAYTMRARATGVPVGVVVQDIYSAGMREAADGRMARAMARIEGRTLRRATGVAVIHQRFGAWLENNLELDPSRVTVLRNWTHLDTAPVEVDRAAVRRRLGWREDETVVLHTGAMGEKQGLENVVEAARCAEYLKLPVRFVLMGDGGQRARLTELADGVSTLQFLDPVSNEDYPEVLRSADVLLVNEKPGVAEMAVPSKLTSYFSTGLPVVAATESTSTTADEVRAAGAGIVVEPGRPEDLLGALDRLGRDPGLRTMLGAAGPVYCSEVLSEKAALDGYERWLYRLAGQQAPEAVAPVAPRHQAPLLWTPELDRSA